MQIDLNPEQQRFISSLINGGVFARGEDVVLAGIEEMRQKQLRQQVQREVFERDIAPALQQLDAGQGRVLSVETFLHERKNA